MKNVFSTKKQKILLVINVVLILLYFIFGIADFALVDTSNFIFLWKVFSIIIPWIIIYFTAPRTNDGYKFTVSIWAAILIVYFICKGNMWIKGNEYVYNLGRGILKTDVIRFNMIMAILLSSLAFISGFGILYRIKEKNKINAVIETQQNEVIEYVYYDENGNISETPTSHRVIK